MSRHHSPAHESRVAFLPFRHGPVACIALAIVMSFTSVADAAVIGGTIESLSEDGRRMTLKLRSGSLRQFAIGSTARVTKDKSPFPRNKLEEGMSVTVYTSGIRITEIRIRELAKKPTTPTPLPNDSPKPEMTPTPTPTETGSDTTPAEDWPTFRGPDRNNRSASTGLSDTWSGGLPKAIWGARGLGVGFSSVAVANGKVYTMGDRNGREVVICLPLEGNREVKPLWYTPTNASTFKEGQGDGPRGTPTVDGDRVYALGASGDLVCLEADSGRQVWHRNILRDFGGSNIVWGISESPLVDGEHVICTPGGRDGTMVALNKKTGDTVWASKSPSQPQTSYSSINTVDVDGLKVYVNFVQNAVIAVRASDGEFLWQSPRPANDTANCSAPVIWKNLVFAASGYGTGGTCFRFTRSGDKIEVEEVYHTNDMKNHHGGMVVVDGYLYGSSDPGILTCIRLEDGNVQWRERDVKKGSLTYADGKLFFRMEEGPLIMVRCDPESARVLGRIDQPFRSNKPAWPHPVVADGKLFIRDQDTLLVYGLKSTN